MIGGVPGRISKPVAGSERDIRQRRWPDLITAFTLLPFPPSPTPPNFISCPLPLSIYLPLVPTLSSQPDWHVPQTSGWKPALPFLSKTNSGNLCHRGIGITHFPTPLIAPPSMICPPPVHCEWSSLDRASDCIIWNHPFFSHCTGALSAHVLSSNI